MRVDIDVSMALLKFGGASSVQPTGSADTILGVTPYADGVIACASTDIYFSQDGITWVTINKLSAGGGDDYATFTGQKCYSQNWTRSNKFCDV